MSDPEQTLYLIDGSGFIFRAYYGLRASMSAADGTPTNAVYGFMRLILNVLRDKKPSHVAVVFDPSGPTFRNEAYADYKANRKAPPDDLIPQFALCREAIEALNIPALLAPGYEADDVIGTLAVRWAATGRKCVIVSADKDMMQLVTDDVTMWDGKEKYSARDEVVAKFGVEPAYVTDVLGLAGDSSDNIPGVPGIGEKTGSALLLKHGPDMESLLAVAHTIKGKRGANLVEFAEQARLSKRLATIALDAPVEYNEALLLRREPDKDALTVFLRRMNFKRFLKEFALDKHSTSKLEADGYRTVVDAEGLEEILAAVKEAGGLALDLQVDGSPRSGALVGLSVAWAPGQAAYIPLGHCTPAAAGEQIGLGALAGPPQLSLGAVKEAFGPLLADPAFPKVGQDCKREWHVLKHHGMDYAGYTGDAILFAYLLDPNRLRYSIEDMSADLLGHSLPSLKEVTGAKKIAPPFAQVPLEIAAKFSAERADVAWRLRDELLPRIEASADLKRLLNTLEVPLLPVLGRLETAGILVDVAQFKAQSKAFKAELAVLTEEIHALAGEPFNIGSPKQLARILFEVLGLTPGKKTKTGYSTNKEVLDDLSSEHALPGKVLRYRFVAYLRNTYLDAIPKLVDPDTGRVHTTFHQAAATGRISSSQPNLQNIPVRTEEGRAIRRAFIARPGCKLVSADYSQVELRLLAHFSEDPGLIAAFTEAEDVHRRTAAEVFEVPESEVDDALRNRAKAVNYGLMYGLTGFGLSRQIGIPRREADAIRKRYFERYAGVRTYLDGLIETAKEEKVAHTLMGRVRPLPDINSRRFVARKASERLAINTPIQGTAADILKLAMLELDRRLTAEGLESKVLLTVHDELLLEVPEAELDRVPALLKTVMEGAAELRVPLIAEARIGDSWADIH